MQNIYGNYSGLVTSPYWQKKHDVMLIQVRIFSGKQNNPSITWEWPGRDPVWSDAWEASSNFRKNFLKFLPIDTFCNAAGDSVGQEQPAMNVIFLDSLKKTLLCMQALLATHPAEQELSPTQHSGDYPITCSSCLLILIQGKTLARAVVFPHPPGVGCSSFPHGSHSQGRGWSCLGLPTESDQYWCWQSTHPRGNPAAWCWDRDHTAKAGQHVKRRKACVGNMAEKR